MNNGVYDLFFSYSRNSLPIAEEIVYKLEQYGLHIWFDRTDVVLGSDIYLTLSATLCPLRIRHGVIFLIDETFFIKTWCLDELNLTIQQDIPSFPILYNYEKTSIPEEYGLLKNKNMVTIRQQGDIEYAINKLLYAILDSTNVSGHCHINSATYTSLVRQYHNCTRVQNEKVVCADNIARFITCTKSSELSAFDLFSISVIRRKCDKLFSQDTLNVFDIKNACCAVEKLIEKFIPI